MVRDGQIDLKTAQREIAADWIAAYKKYVGGEPAAAEGSKATGATAPAPSPAAAGSTAPTSPVSGNVWVNTRSGVFWRPGTAFYGRTKAGRYMSEADAAAAGFRPAKGQ